MNNKLLQFWVGVFILAGLGVLCWLAMRSSGLGSVDHQGYEVTAEFDNIGSLTLRAPVKLAGVVVGRVVGIGLDQNTFQGKVVMQLQKKYNKIPIDSAASIYTAGLLGANYVNLTPGNFDQFLKNGSVLSTTHSALVLENLIGQLLFSLKSSGKPSSTKNQLVPNRQ